MTLPVYVNSKTTSTKNSNLPQTEKSTRNQLSGVPDENNPPRGRPNRPEEEEETYEQGIYA